MTDHLGSSGSFLKRVSTFKQGRPPRYIDTFSGEQAAVDFSASLYYAYGWEVNKTKEDGKPWTMTATIDSDIGSNNQPITTGSSYVTTNWSFHYNTSEKDLLHCGKNGVNITAASWITQISGSDIVALDYYISNPPTTQSLNSSVTIPAPITWTAAGGFSTNSTSINASQVVWAMTKNGVKTVPIVQPVLRMTMVVPNTYILTSFTNNLNRVYSKASVNSEIGVPSNYYNCMAQDSDPSSGTVVTDNNVNLPLIYGWLKMPPTIDENGLQITITQDWVYGLYYQNMYGSRI